jgi:hypothetical protein
LDDATTGCWLKTTGQAARVIIATPLTIVTPMMFEGSRIMIIMINSGFSHQNGVFQ